MDLHDAVAQSVQNMLNADEPFTSACISHPLIKGDASIRHMDVSAEIRQSWRKGEMIGSDGTPYTRTTIDVFPEGPGSVSQAWLYHPPRS